MPALIEGLPAASRERWLASFDEHAEAARTAMLFADISDLVLASFERDVARNRALFLGLARSEASGAAPDSADTPLLTTNRWVYIRRACARVAAAAARAMNPRN